MALVLALAGSALLYTSCTKDYSPDIKSLQEQIDNINTSTTDGLPYVRTQLENLKSELGTLSGKVSSLDTELSGKISALETKVNNAINSINEAIAKKADQSYVEAELADLKEDIADLVKRLDAIDGEDGRLAEIDAAIEALQSASGAIDDLFATYAKFIQSIAYVPATTSGVVEAFPYTLVDGTTSDTLIVASFKITPPDARTRAALENSALVAVKTKSAAAAPDTLKIKKIVYRDDAPGYVDVFATLDGILDAPATDATVAPALEEEGEAVPQDEPAASGSIAIAFAVQQVENTLTESVTSDYAPVEVGAAHDLLFQIYDAEAAAIVDPETEDHEVRVSPTTKPDSVALFTAGRWSVVADLDGAYLTPAEAKDLFGVKDIKAVTPKAGDTTVTPKADKEGYYSNNYGTGKGKVKDAFKVSAWPTRPKTVVDCVVDGAEYYKVAVSLKNSHAATPVESGKAVGVYHAVPDSVELNLTPVDKYGQPQDVVIPWDYKYYDNIKDTLIAKIKVDGDRANLVGADKTPTWNTVTNTDYTEGTGAVTEHSNDKEAIDATLVSAAEYGKIDSTYVYSIQKFDRSTATEYVGNFEYVVEARPADAVIELGPIDTIVHFSDVTKIAVEAITAAYNYHKDYYAKYPIDTVAADAQKMGKVDSTKVTFNDKKEDIALSGDGFAFAEGKETTNFALNLDKVGQYKVYVYTHFANVGYTFVVTINTENNPAQIAPKATYVTVDSETHYSVQVKGDVDTTGAKYEKYHYYLVDEPFQDYIKVINYAFGSDSLMIDLQTITKMPADTAVKAPSTPVAVTRLAADSTVAQLKDKANYEWDKWDSLAFEVAVRLIPEVKKDATVDSVAVKLWTVDPIPVFDGGNGIVVEHEKDQLAKTNVIAGIHIEDFNGVALNDSTGKRAIGPDPKTGELVVNYDQEIEIGDVELVSGADYIEELKLNLDKETGDLSLELNQGTIVTPIVVRVPIKLTYMLDRGLNKTAYVYVTFIEKGSAAPSDGE